MRIILILDEPRIGYGGYTRLWMETDLLEFKRDASPLNDYHYIAYEANFNYPPFFDEDDDWDEWHGYNCVCEDCIQNYPERRYLLDDWEPWGVE